MSAPILTEPSDRHSLWWVPNALTIGRILTVPILMAGILALGLQKESWLASIPIVGGLFIAATATDWLDGFLARRWKVVSGFGRMIDPIADKLLVAGCLIALCIVARGSWIFMYPAVAIIFRDILVSGAREHAALTGKVMPPTKLAKWKTAFEMAAIAALIVWTIGLAVLPFDDAVPQITKMAHHSGLAMLWIAALLSVYTGSLYLRAAVTD
ncbi:MAG: CDP-diacylglycerol--glycerol-3-phosphate 3-phosphatidyltransferase [Litorimonas sp.]